MTTPWEADVLVAMSLATAGRGNADTSRVLAAEVQRLRAALAGEPHPLVALRCPRCGQVADSAEKRLDGPTRWHHGQVTHLDLSPEIKAVRGGV